MKCLWVSNASFVKSGYGVGTRAVVTQMLRDGHEVDVLAYWGLHGAELEIDGINNLPPWADQWANDAILWYFNERQYDFVLYHRDAWVNAHDVMEAAPSAMWTPIDQHPLGDPSAEVMKRARWNATMSRFGVESARAAGLAAECIPHSAGAAYRYSRDRSARSRLLGVPEECFLVLVAAANQGYPARKGWPEILKALATFMKRHDDVWVHAHTNISRVFGGPDIRSLAISMDVPLARLNLLQPAAHWNPVTDEQMAAIYSAADVLLATAYAEGFGIPILEAQACGTPVITTNVTAMPEITWNGEAVDCWPWVTAHYGEWGVPKVTAIVDALELRYSMRNSQVQRELAERTAREIADNWNDEVIYERHWRPWLARIEQDLAMTGELRNGKASQNGRPEAHLATVAGAIAAGAAANVSGD